MWADTFNEVTKWIDPNFFFSKSEGWGGELNTSSVGVIADFVLSYTQGDILEIGVGLSSIFLSALAKKYDRFFYQCDLDLGTRLVELRDILKGLSFKGKMYEMTSDNMFANNTFTPLAFSFIDGFHEYEQVKREFWNVEKYTVDNGYIMLHDSYPPSVEWVGPGGCGSCGDTYLFRQEIEKDKRFDTFTFVGGVGHIGLTLIRKKPVNRPYYQE